LEGIIPVNVIASKGMHPNLSSNLLNGPAAYDLPLADVLQPYHNEVRDCDQYFTVAALPSAGNLLTHFGLLSVLAKYDAGRQQQARKSPMATSHAVSLRGMSRGPAV
jgi:hypothetical protein